MFSLGLQLVSAGLGTHYNLYYNLHLVNNFPLTRANRLTFDPLMFIPGCRLTLFQDTGVDMDLPLVYAV